MDGCGDGRRRSAVEVEVEREWEDERHEGLGVKYGVFGNGDWT